MGEPLRIKRTTERLKSGDRRAGRDVGHSLMVSSLDVLNEFRREACAVVPEDIYAEGYRDALLDVVAAYAADVGGRLTNWPKHWREIWEILKYPATVTEVAGFLSVSLATASRGLTAMRKEGLISATKGKDSRTRRYQRARTPKEGER